jgi:uncharacterized protein with von Willebrand factor type A (vWA) domain
MKTVLAFMVVVIVVLLAECEDSTKTTAVLEARLPSYAQRPLDNSWPVSTEENTSLSDDLLMENYYIILDGSGSMKDNHCAEESHKMAVAKTAITQFFKQISTEANIGLYSFDKQGSSERVFLGKNNQSLFHTAIEKIQSGGGTPLETAIQHGYQQLTTQAKRQLGYGDYHLVIVTDGVASNNEEPGKILQTILEESPVRIHSIGFCLDDNHSLNQVGFTAYTAAGNAEELTQGLQAILSELPDFDLRYFK